MTVTIPLIVVVAALAFVAWRFMGLRMCSSLPACCSDSSWRLPAPDPGLTTWWAASSTRSPATEPAHRR
jgi:hypothetical protein